MTVRNNKEGLLIDVLPQLFEKLRAGPSGQSCISSEEMNRSPISPVLFRTERPDVVYVAGFGTPFRRRLTRMGMLCSTTARQSAVAWAAT